MSFKKIVFSRLYLIILFIYVILVTRGSFNLIGYEVRGSSYDSLAVSLLKGSAEVEFKDISQECSLIDGKHYMYFGPFPSLLRLVLNFCLPSFYGNWSRVSCLIAALTIVIFLFKITDFSLNKNKSLINKDREFLFILFILSFALSSPIVFLMSCAYIYHEAILWGLCWGVVGLYYFLCYLENGSNKIKSIFLISLSASFALLSRVTFALPLYFILCCTFINELSKLKRTERFLKSYSISLLTTVLFVSFQLWYNYARYKSLFAFGDDSNHYYPCLIYHDDCCAFIKKAGNFNFNRLIQSFNYYFLPIKECFFNSFPFIKAIAFSSGNPRIYHNVEPIIPLTFISPLIIFSFVIGFKYLVKSKMSILYKSSFIGYFLEALLILLYCGISSRYMGDLIPLFLYFFPLFIMSLNSSMFVENIKFKLKLGIILILIFSIYCNFASVLYWNAYQNWGAPDSYKKSLVNVFNEINNHYNLKN